MAENEKKETAYSILKGERDTAVQENVKLTQKSKELWEKAANLDIQVLDVQRENTALKAKLEALNESARQNLVKKNFEGERLQKLETENEDLKFQIGYKNAKIEELHVFQFNFRELEKSLAELKSEKEALEKNFIQLNENSILDKQRFDTLKEIEDSQNVEIASLKNRLSVLNTDNRNFIADNGILKITISDLQSEIDNLSWELAPLKSQSEKWNWRKKVFTVVVSAMASLANFTHIGDAYLALIKNPDWLHKLTAYGSVLTFDLAILLFTLNSERGNAKKFSIGVFILCFFALGKPFELLEKGKTGLFWQNLIAGAILSAMFAFIPYLNSELFKKQ